MKPILLNFVGGSWDGRTLRSDSDDQEEIYLAAECYEMTHHGSVGAACVGLGDVAGDYARDHGWASDPANSASDDHRYVVCERRETETELTITLRHRPAEETGAGHGA